MVINLQFVILILFFNILSVKNVFGAFNNFQTDEQRQKELEDYKVLYKKERLKLIRSVAKFRKLQDAEAQYNQVLEWGRKVFYNIDTTRTVLEANKFDPVLSPFPSDNRELFDALSRMLQYTIFYGDIIMQLPDITEYFFKKSKHWKDHYDWALAFCSKLKFLEKEEVQLFNLVKQELYVELRKKNYKNPNWGRQQCDADCKNLRSTAKKMKYKANRDIFSRTLY